MLGIYASYKMTLHRRKHAWFPAGELEPRLVYLTTASYVISAAGKERIKPMKHAFNYLEQALRTCRGERPTPT